MARKSPITGLARPEGIIDDVIGAAGKAAVKTYRQNTRRIIKAGETLGRAQTRATADRAKTAIRNATRRNKQIEAGVNTARTRRRPSIQTAAVIEERTMLNRKAANRAAKKAAPKKAAPRKKAAPKRVRRGPYGDFDSWLNDMNPRGF